MSLRAPTLLFVLAATAGLFFASFSTFDFVQHLDRQVHDIHCSFVPGLVDASHDAEAGCQVTMMSPYSSFLRKMLWGGIPISLPAMAMFAFLLYRGVDLGGRPAAQRKPAATFLLVASVIPVIASLVMGAIAFIQLGAACKLCIGIYISSGVCFATAAWGLAQVRREIDEPTDASKGNIWLHGTVQLGLFIGLPVLVYGLMVPDYSRYLGTCGALESPADPYGVMVELGDGRGVEAIEVFDPLCPACRAFEGRLAAAKLDESLSRKAVMFPLDDSCNWMISQALHPGACSVSEAVLCANDSAVAVDEVIAWAFDHQEDIRKAATADPKAAERLAKQQFPQLAKCIGSAEAKSKLNKSLRWAVANELPVLTPQLYVDGVKMCDEDTDLGLDFTLTRMLERHRQGTLRPENAR